MLLMKTLKFYLLVLSLFCAISLSARPEKKIKNVILMIPDGTSTSVLSLARWYKYYCAKDKTDVKLALDPYLCGLVKTHSSNAPIGDSAPTSSWYATGQASRSGFIAMYPPQDAGRDLVEIDTGRAYQPLVTVLEAAKLTGKKTGLVFTCQFPHATPADFSAHHYNRDDYATIAKQMVYNNMDVVFGGGTGELNPDGESALKSQGYTVLKNDIAAFRNINAGHPAKTWALFGKKEMPYDFDRDTANIPSLAEMTDTSIESLKNDSGFFLMVEGSKVDWAAHANDIAGMMSEFLAFDKAVEAAISFARLDSETVVIICPDHGTGGPSMGNENSNHGYDKLSLKQIFEPIAACGNMKKATPAGVADSLKKAARAFIGFTTTGHTGEDVFLAIYNPDPARPNPHGLVRSDSINRYICALLKLTDALGNPTLRQMTDSIFVPFHVAPNSNIFKKTAADSVVCWRSNIGGFGKPEKIKPVHQPASINVGDIYLIVEKGKDTFTIPADKNFYYRNNQKVTLKTVTVWVDRAANGHGAFYMTRQLVDLLR